MNVTRVQVPQREQYLAQIDRLLNSHVLHGSESLCKLLRYLAEHSLDHPGSPVKEYQIATEVFGRSPNFDPQSDSTIRVQAGRLRLKIAEYYAAEGADEPIQVEMPKGTYVVSFHPREPSAARQLALSRSARHGEMAADGKANGNWKLAFLAVLALLIVTVTTAAWLLARKPTATDRAPEPVPPAFTTFWKAFADGPEEPWVIFSNGAFVGRPETGMRYFDPARDSRDEIPSTQDFNFHNLDSGPRKGDLAIVNVHPESGEAQFWIGSPSHANLVEDYSIVALVRGLNPAKSVLILAGTTTIGTQAAVEFVCQQNSLEELLPRLQVSDTGELKPFE